MLSYLNLMLANLTHELDFCIPKDFSIGHLTLDTSVKHLTSNISDKTADTDKRETQVISERETVQNPENYFFKAIVF